MSLRSHKVNVNMLNLCYGYGKIKIQLIQLFRSDCKKKHKRKVQEVPQSQVAALPRHQEEEETDKTKQRTKSTKISSLFTKRGNRNAKKQEQNNTREDLKQIDS